MSNIFQPNADAYCVITVNTLRGGSLLKAVKQAVTTNETMEGRHAFVFNIQVHDGEFRLIEVPSNILRVAESEYRDLREAARQHDSI